MEITNRNQIKAFSLSKLGTNAELTKNDMKKVHFAFSQDYYKALKPHIKDRLKEQATNSYNAFIKALD